MEHSEARSQVGSSTEPLDDLLRLMRRQSTRGADPDVREVLGWLHGQTGAHVALVADAGGTVEAATEGFPRTLLAELTPLLDRLSGGQLAAAASTVGALHVRCEALGPREPRPVLVMAGTSEPTPEVVALNSQTAGLLALLRRAGTSDRTWRDYQYKARQLRFAVLSALLTGEPMLARRMTAGAVPPLLDTERLRVYLLHCPPADRDRIARAQQDPSGYHGPDLLVQCPVFKEHLICLLADEEDTGSSAGQARVRGEALHDLVRDDPRYALGVSGSHPLGATGAAYSEAVNALAAAHTTPQRVAYFHGRTPLDGVLHRQSAIDWARALLKPLESAPKTSTDVTRLAVSVPRSAVARLLGLSRNTVTAHVRRAERALGQDLADVRSRAAVQLALALRSSCTEPDSGGHRPSPALGELLDSERAAVWAHTTLRPLEARYRRTLQAWIDANADAQRAAGDLGVSRNTVRAHLRTAETALGLDLLTTGMGIHDVVHALHIAALRQAD